MALQTNQTNSVNRLSAAIKLLSQYYASLGRNDIITLLNTSVTGGSSAQTSLTAAGLGVGETLSGASASIDPQIIDDLLYLLLDTSEAAYFTKDLLLATALLSKFEVNVAGNKYDGIDNFVQCVYEPVRMPEIADLNPLVLEEGDAQAPPSPPAGISPEADLTTAQVSTMIRSNIWTGSGLGHSLPFRFDTPVVNTAPKDPDRLASPTLSVWLFPNLRVGPPTRNTTAVSLFVNAIPTLEMSRCVPYINMFFVAAVPPILGERTKQLSLLRFLGMNSNDPNNYDKIGMRDALPDYVAGGFTGQIIADATIDHNAPAMPDDISKWGTSVSAAGMELFTSPQTLVNANINSTSTDPIGGIFQNFSGVAGGVLDPFQPLLTLDTISITVAGLGQALLANRTASMSFTLHDRSRMSDIAPLISADLFGSTYVMLEYGWMHPHSGDAEDNVYGALLNSMRARGVFNIISSNFTIGNDGQVKVRIELASRGGSDAKSLPIGVGNVVPAAPLKSMLQTHLAKLFDAEDGQSDASREVRQKINVTLDASNSRSSVVPRSLWADYLELLRSDESGTAAGVEKITDIIQQLVGDPTDGADSGLLLESETSLVREVMARSTALKDQPDAFHPKTLPNAFQEAESYGDAAQELGSKISLGKIMLSFVGRPLAESGRYDEVQLMFYRFNNRAGEARKYDTIANFLVDYSRFHLRIQEYAAAFPGMSIEGFVNMINSEFVNDPMNLNYGFEMATLYRELSAVQKEEAETEAQKKEQQARITAINDNISDAILRMYGEGGEPIFTLPRVVTYFETLPAYVGDETSGFKINPSKNILRIHIFDSNATPHDDQKFILAAMNDSELAVKINSAAGTASSDEEVRDNGSSNGTVTAQEGNGTVVQTVDNSDNTSKYIIYTTKISNRDIKDVIKDSTPSLTFGSQFSAISSVSLSSNTSGAVNNVLLLNAVTKNNQVQPGASNDLEDVTVIPASARLTLLGCPVVEYGQQFFVDMGTGTTADNLYRVTGITHTLSAGRFETSLDLTFCSNGTMSTFRSVLAASLPKLIAMKQATTGG